MARSIEVQEFPATQARIKAAQRVGVVLLLVLMAAALAGAFGMGGPVAGGNARQGALAVEFPRFARNVAPTSIDVHLGQAAASTVEVTLHGELADAFHVEIISPRPDQVSATGDATTYRFIAVPGEAHRIRFEGQFETIGPVHGQVRAGQDAVPIRTFVHP